MDKRMFAMRPSSALTLFVKKLSLIFALLACAFAAGLATASPALAWDESVMAYSASGDTETPYYSTDDAIRAGYEGKTIYLNVDWMFTGTMTVADSKSLTIDMNGHKITSQGGGSVIRLYEHSKLTLQSSGDSAEFTYKGYSNEDGFQVDVTTTTGGLVTGGSSSDGGGVRMDNDSTLTLDGVSIAGNYGDDAGGIYAKKECTINMKGGATIEHNKGDAGGVYVNQENTKMYLDGGACICQNYGSDCGGGVYSCDDGTEVHLEGKSSISGNTAMYGGGLFFSHSYFRVKSDDKTGSVKENRAQESGGGIYAQVRFWSTNEGLVKGLSITGNTSEQAGGGLYLEQKWTEVTECDITGNVSGKSGGGVYVSNDHNRIISCKIKDNTCGWDDEGAGVFLRCDYDLVLSGTTIITSNKRNTLGSAGGGTDDLTLQEGAYLTGGVDSGSSIGLRSGSSTDRRIGRNLSSNASDAFFMDDSGYYVGYESNGSDMWQRKGKKECSLTVNGKPMGHYKKGEEVTLNGSTLNTKKRFWYWDADESTAPAALIDQITGDAKYTQSITFTMPETDVDLCAVYAGFVARATLTLEAPEAGKELPTMASFKRADATEDADSYDVAVVWYKLRSDGKKTFASGTAEYGVTYVAEVFVDQRRSDGIYFDSRISADRVTVSTGSGSSSAVKAAETSVDDAGALTIWTQSYQTNKPAITKVDDASVSVTAGALESTVKDALPSFVTARIQGDKTVTLETNTEDVEWPSGLFAKDGVVANPDGKSSTFTMKVPLAKSDLVADAEKSSVEVTITVLANENVATPSLSLVSGTYDRYGVSSAGLSDDLKLKVFVACATEGAKVWYQVDGGDKQAYEYGSEIVLEGAADRKQTHELEVWAEKDGKQSEHVKAKYVLDDMLQKSMTIGCYDTALYSDDEEAWTSSFDVVANLGSSVTIVAPAQEGRAFSHWEWADAPEGTRLTQRMLTIKEFSTDLKDKIKAVYTPVVTKVDVGLSAPEAHKALATAASSVKVGIGDGSSMTDITSYFANGAQLSWSPTAEDDGTAAHGTCYTATLSLDADASSSKVNYILADDLELLVNGEDLDGGAYVTNTSDGGKEFHVLFPSTSSYEYASITELGEVKLSFGEACECQAEQDEKKAETWGLPKQVSVQYECGESEPLDVEWEAPIGFDKTKLRAQTLTVTGKVVYPSYVDSTGAPEIMTATIKIAGPNGEETANLASAKVTLSKASLAYNGKTQKPSVKSVTLDGTTLKAGTDYTASVASGKKVGTYKVTITGKGNYSGTKTASYTITPKSVTGLKAKKAKKSFKASWAKYSSQRTGVQVRYSTKANMKNAKTVKVKGASAKAKTVKKLKKKTRYYVQVRSYKTVGGKTYYSGWSAKKSVKTK